MKTAFVLAMICILMSSVVCPAETGETAVPPGINELFSLMAGMQSGDSSSGHMPPDQVFPVMIRDLGLREAQIRQIAIIFLDFARVQAAEQARITSAGLDLIHQLLLAEQIDASLAEQRMREIVEAEGTVKMAGMRAILAAVEVLTPEQRRTLQSLILRMIASTATPEAK